MHEVTRVRGSGRSRSDSRREGGPVLDLLQPALDDADQAVQVGGGEVDHRPFEQRPDASARSRGAQPSPGSSGRSRPSEANAARSTPASWSVSRSAGVYSLERETFAMLGGRVPGEPPLDLVVSLAIPTAWIVFWVFGFVIADFLEPVGSPDFLGDVLGLLLVFIPPAAIRFAWLAAARRARNGLPRSAWLFADEVTAPWRSEPVRCRSPLLIGMLSVCGGAEPVLDRWLAMAVNLQRPPRSGPRVQRQASAWHASCGSGARGGSRYRASRHTRAGRAVSRSAVHINSTGGNRARTAGHPSHRVAGTNVARVVRFVATRT